LEHIHVFEVELNLMGTETFYKKLHFLGYNTFQVSHIATDYIYDPDGEFESESPVEIVSIKKLAGISDICNPYFILEMGDDEDIEEYDGKEILEIAKKLPEERTFSFKCECHESILVPQGNWPYVICPNCENRILRRDVKEIGGIYIYERSDNKK